MKIYKIIQGILIMSLVIILGACTQDLPPDDDTNPDGGDGGGWLIAEGTPELVAKCAESYTGQFLSRVLAPPKVKVKRKAIA